MQLREGTLGGLPLLEVTGDLDRASASLLQDALLEHIAGGRRRVLVDMHSCAHIDSGGLAVIFGALNEIGSRGWLGMISLTPPVHRVMKTVGLTQHERLLIFDDEEDVLKSLLPSS